VGQAAEVLNWESIALGLLGLCDVLAGRLAEGVGVLERATSLAKERRELFNVAFLEGWLGEGSLASGDPEQARRHGRASLERARTQSQRGTEAWAWRLLGEIAAALDPPSAQEAEAAYREALTRASDLGMRPLAAHCHLGLGKLYRRAGDRVRAEEHFTLAATMYRDMDMRFWLEQAEGGDPGSQVTGKQW
jgi:tetratricopeptide (TPR) repeat protein